jgi:AcrR family transcriptional regulator
MTDKTRQYRMKARAEAQEATRRRITESAVALHGTLGPSRTSMSAVAEHAGVRRSTLYRHFPDEDALFDACSAHWAAANPLPDPSAWAAIADPAERLQVALGELYPYYRRTQGMIENILRDLEMAPVQRNFAPFAHYLAAVHDVLLAGRGRTTKATRAVVGHALAFTTWRSLAVEQGLGDTAAVKLTCALVECAFSPAPRTR